MGMFDHLIPGANRRRGAFDHLVPETGNRPVGQAPMTQEEASMAILPSQRLAGESDPMVDAIMRESRPEPSGIDRALTATSATLGAPVDAVNVVLDGLGRAGLNVPGASDRPFLGSAQIEDGLQAVTGSRESAEIEARNPGLTQAGGAPIGQRAYESFMATPEATEIFLTRNYGPENDGWYRLTDAFGNPTDRVVVRDEDGTERIFNPPGIDFGDVASMAGVLPDFGGALAGAAASIPAYTLGPVAGIPASAGLGALGAQLVGEPVGRLFPENREAEPSITEDVLPRAAGEAGADALIGLVMGPAGRLWSAATNRVRAPFADSASDPLATEFRDAATRLQRQGYDVSPLASEQGAGGFVPRMEGMLEKLPGSAEAMRQYRRRGDEAVSRFQRDLIGDADAPTAGRRAVGEIQSERDQLLTERNYTLGGVDQRLDQAQDAITARQGPRMAAEDAGAQTRSGLERAREEFRGEARTLYDAARNAPGGRDPIVSTAPVKEIVERIRQDLPPSASTSGGPSSEFTPDGLSRLMRGIDDIADTITIDQARRMRGIVNDALDDKTLLPGVPERYLGQLSRSLTQAIEGSVDRAGSPQLREALSQANTFYRENVDQFARRGVAELYRPPTSQGFVENEQIVQRLLSGRGRPGLIRDMKATLGPDSPEWAATRRQAAEEILETGRNRTLSGRRVVDADGFVDRLNRLDDETVQELFGVADAQQLRNLAADISNRTRYLDADALSQSGSPQILAQLRRAASIEDRLAREYRDNVISPFLRGEDGAAARMNAEELVPFLYRRASPQEIENVMGRLSPNVRDQVERGTMADIIETAITRGGNHSAGVRRLITGEGGPAQADSIANILGAGGDAAARQQAARIERILGPDKRQALQDIAVITARRQERDATTSAVGGLAAGAAVTGILSSPSRAVNAAVVARGIAALVTAPAFRNWVSNTARRQMTPDQMAATTAVSPYMVRGIATLAEESADVQAALDWLAGGASQIDEAGRRVTRPPDGSTSWEEYFSNSTR